MKGLEGECIELCSIVCVFHLNATGMEAVLGWFSVSWSYLRVLNRR